MQTLPEIQQVRTPGFTKLPRPREPW